MVRFVRSAGGGPVVLVLALLLIGCDKTVDRKPVYPVTGTVLVNKKPTKGVVISFHPKGELDNPRSLRSFTTTGDDGAFRLTTYETHDGAPEGEYVVTVYWPGFVPPGSHIGEVGPDLLKGRYSNPKTSPLRATIRPEPNELSAIEVNGP